MQRVNRARRYNVDSVTSAAQLAQLLSTAVSPQQTPLLNMTCVVLNIVVLLPLVLSLLFNEPLTSNVRHVVCLLVYLLKHLFLSVNNLVVSLIC